MADGHLGIWAALAQVWPETAEQRCWNHRLLNVLDKLPKRVQAEARHLLTQIPYAPTRQEATKRRDQFAKRFRRECPDAVDILERRIRSFKWHRKCSLCVIHGAMGKDELQAILDAGRQGIRSQGSRSELS